MEYHEAEKIDVEYKKKYPQGDFIRFNQWGCVQIDATLDLERLEYIVGLINKYENEWEK